MIDEIGFRKINSLGMQLDEWKYKSCTAQVGVEDDWATIYIIESEEKNKGHASYLINAMKKYYKNKIFGTSFPLNSIMQHLTEKFELKIYE